MYAIYMLYVPTHLADFDGKCGKYTSPMDVMGDLSGQIASRPIPAGWGKLLTVWWGNLNHISGQIPQMVA